MRGKKLPHIGKKITQKYKKEGKKHWEKNNPKIKEEKTTSVNKRKKIPHI